MKVMVMENDHAPSVNISKDLRRSGLRVGRPDVLLNPGDNMILESTFDDLVQEVR